MKNLKSIYLYFEIVVFLGIAAFCFGAWASKPHQVFSMHEAVEQNYEALQLHTETVTVNLPTAFATHFQNMEIQAVRLYNDAPDWIPSQLSSETVSIDLSRCMDDSKKHLLLIHLLSLHQQPSSYDIRVVDQNGKILQQQSTGVLPAGEMMWRGQIGVVDHSLLPVLKITTDQPGSKAFLCDLVIYDAPGMMYWNLDAPR